MGIYLLENDSTILHRLSVVQDRQVLVRSSDELTYKQYVLLGRGDKITSQVSGHGQGLYWSTRGCIPNCHPGLSVITHWESYDEVLLDLIPVQDDIDSLTSEYATVVEALGLADDETLALVVNWGMNFSETCFPTSSELLEYMSCGMY